MGTANKSGFSDVPAGYGEAGDSLEDGIGSHKHLAQGKPADKVPQLGASRLRTSGGGRESPMSDHRRTGQRN